MKPTLRYFAGPTENREVLSQIQRFSQSYVMEVNNNKNEWYHQIIMMMKPSERNKDFSNLMEKIYHLSKQVNNIKFTRMINNFVSKPRKSKLLKILGTTQNMIHNTHELSVDAIHMLSMHFILPYFDYNDVIMSYSPSVIAATTNMKPRRSTNRIAKA